MEIVVNINGKDIRLKDILNTINDIYNIVNNKCPKCGDKSDREKLAIIKKLIEERLNYGKENNS